MDINPVDVGVAAVVLPPIVAVLNQRNWPAPVKALVALLVMLAYALVAEIMRGPIDFANWRDTALTTAGAGFAAYRLWWQPSGISGRIEATTSLAPDGPPPES